MCAGPFSQLLLGIDEPTNDRFENLLLEKHEVYRPGYTRISFPFWISKCEIDYIVNSVAFIAEHGWKFLKLYRWVIIPGMYLQCETVNAYELFRYNHKTGEWAHTTRLTRFPERKWLSSFSFSEQRPYGTERQKLPGGSDMQQVLDSMQATAMELANINGQSQATSLINSHVANDEPLNALRWFLLPDDIVQQRSSLHLLSDTIAGNDMKIKQ